MIDLKGNPFYLSDEAIAWVKGTLASLTTEEKVGQLFCPIGFSGDADYLRAEMLRFHVGGLMFKTSPPAEVRAAYDFMQRNSKVPMLCAANLEFGSTGFLEGGTHFAQQMGIGATGNPLHAYRMGQVACGEAAAVGCNFAFAPVCDLDWNWRNPIINVRAYGDDPDKVLKMCLAYKRAADEHNMAVSIKHFPGDGVDETDQHLLVSVNSLGCEAWDATYGKVYRGLIADGAKTVMAGHIDQPAWRHRLGHTAGSGTVPATLSKELITGLLRGHLGFNGLVITDATPMVGFTSAMKRSEAVPTAIEAGCDMFLFNKSLEEDFAYMLEGLGSGLLSQGRLEEAVTRILALKASLGLWDTPREKIVPPPEAMSIIGCAQHHRWARACADEAITLVKDRQCMLPLDPQKTPRILLEVLGPGAACGHVSQYMQEKLTREGFQVTPYEPENYETYRFGVKPFTEKYDAVLYLGNVENASNQTTNRIHWATYWGHGDNVPWFVHEVPVLFASLANPYHMVDVPMIPTYINCYSNNDDTLDALVEKLMGRDTFRGQSPIDPYCGKAHLHP